MTKKQEVLLKLVERLGVRRTIKVTGLSLFNMCHELDGHLELTPEICSDLLEDMFNNTSLLKQTDENITLDWGVFTDGACIWFYNNKQTGEKLTTLATPFYNGYNYVPVNIEDYVVDRFDPNTREWTIVYQEYGGLYDNIEYEEIPQNLEELITWFNEVYFEDVKEIVLDGVRRLRNNAKRKGISVT
jgi:hypothetical protein